MLEDFLKLLEVSVQSLFFTKSDLSFGTVLSNSPRKGAGYLQAFGSVGRTSTAVVNLMVEDDDSTEGVGSRS